ncbi:MAG TPA: helix-turn-helix domain-containing protein [Spirochaetota bacterium]|nr:helix-turn-helix domain-containing protein [Spirochaetota bacterium]
MRFGPDTQAGMYYIDLFPMSDVLVLAAFCQLIIFIIYLALNRRGDWRLNLVLSLVLIFQIVPAASSYVLFHSFQIDYFPLAHMGNASFFFLGPLLFFYLRKYLTGRFFRWKTDIFHFGLFLLALVIFVLFAKEQGNNYMRRAVDIWFALILFMYLLLYAVFSLRLVIKTRKQPEKENRSLFWPVFLFIGSLILLSGRFIVFFIWEIKSTNQLSPVSLEFIYLLSPYTVSIYFMAFIFFTNILILMALSGFHIIRSQTRYRNSRLSSDGKMRIEKRLRDIMETERPYLDPLLSLNTLARRMNISSKELSQIINECCDMNFSDFVNSFRVREVIRLIETGTENRTILDISLDAGFNSKSTFNHAFKKHTGKSPRDYLAKSPLQSV